MSLKKLVQDLQRNSSQLKDIQSIEYSKIASFYWFNLIQNKENRLITDRTFTGFDVQPATALAKATSEYIERQSFSNGHKMGLKSCSTKRSDGFAAYPKLGLCDRTSQVKARENALNEAIERYAWATWWDDLNISFEYSEFSLEGFEAAYPVHGKIISEISSQKNIVKIHIIRPEFHNYDEHSLCIIVAEFYDGIVTGGACGKLEDQTNIMTRALSELLRHALVLIQNKEKPDHLSLYEERLLYFGSPVGKQSFFERLTHVGSKKVVFPKLCIDEKIPAIESHSVHRCLFKDQPPFIGGAIERMCL